MTELEKLVLMLYEMGAVKFGRFQLTPSKISPINIDLRLLISHPSALKTTAVAFSRILQTLEFDLLGAIPYSGLPIGTAIALEMNRPLIFPRKEGRSSPTSRHVEGIWQVGQKVVVIDDTITTGESALGGVAMLKAAGLQVKDIVALLDREQGADDNVEGSGYTLHSVLRLDDLLITLENHGRIDGKTRREVLALA
ncbi:MAG: orotate phosphoribosyltransferase [Candidatus Promineifilaceae bacterium]